MVPASIPLVDPDDQAVAALGSVARQATFQMYSIGVISGDLAGHGSALMSQKSRQEGFGVSSFVRWRSSWYSKFPPMR